ncbi:hypothetical protein Hypma_000915 [Hypsizygus marmoreus]|uniref:Uncharacterized protein n=1 Tax=Hypsizygus marmoreus TaxID=39966 RepID=A0A369JF90_HYPMA|nr:hypothetical protein Hypma_000915 [Hypsizygus marmoreus]
MVRHRQRTEVYVLPCTLYVCNDWPTSFVTPLSSVSTLTQYPRLNPDSSPFETNESSFTSKRESQAPEWHFLLLAFHRHTAMYLLLKRGS